MKKSTVLHPTLLGSGLGVVQCKQPTVVTFLNTKNLKEIKLNGAIIGIGISTQEVLAGNA